MIQENVNTKVVSEICYNHGLKILIVCEKV